MKRPAVNHSRKCRLCRLRRQEALSFRLFRSLPGYDDWLALPNCRSSSVKRYTHAHVKEQISTSDVSRFDRMGNGPKPSPPEVGILSFTIVLGHNPIDPDTSLKCNSSESMKIITRKPAMGRDRWRVCKIQDKMLQFRENHLFSFFPSGFSAMAGIYAQRGGWKRRGSLAILLPEFKRTVDGHCRHLPNHTGTHKKGGGIPTVSHIEFPQRQRTHPMLNHAPLFE